MNRKSHSPRHLVIVAAAWLVCPVACGQGVARPVTYPARVLIIRHAEKADDVLSVHLSEAGRKRADALPELFEKSDSRPEPFPKPDFIVAASDSKNSHRPTETVAPLAKSLGLTVNNKHSSDDPDELAKHLLTTPKYAGKIVLVSWRHTRLPELVKKLGAEDAPKEWKDEKFDRVWVLDFDGQGKVTFHDKPQQLMPGDSKK